jgi:hypothetical protein
MPEYCLRLLEDRIDPASPHVYLPAASRAIYVRDGEVSIESAEAGQHVVAGATWLRAVCCLRHRRRDPPASLLPRSSWMTPSNG